MVEGRPFLLLLRVHQDELRSPFYGLAIPERGGSGDPVSRAGYVEREILKLRAQAAGPLVVGGRALGEGKRRRQQHKRECEFHDFLR